MHQEQCNNMNIPALVVGVIGTIVSTISHLPLLYKSCKSDTSLDQLSKKTLFVGTLGHALWFVYGILVVDYILIVSGFFTTVIDSILFLLKCKRTYFSMEKVYKKNTTITTQNAIENN